MADGAGRTLGGGLKADPVAVTLALDGHVKVCAGRKGRLPEHFVARQTSCLPVTVGYRVNALGGKPLPCIHKPLDPKPVATTREDIVPDLTGPDPGAPALTLVFDREG